MKLLIVIIVSMCVFLLGLMFTNYYKHKLIIFSDVVKFCNLLSSSIRFNKLTIVEFIKFNNDNFSSDFVKILNDYFIDGKEINCNYLTLKEIENITRFFKSLGKHDVKGEVENIENNKVFFNSIKTEIKNNNDRIGVLGVKLGVLGALLVFIIFI